MTNRSCSLKLLLKGLLSATHISGLLCHSKIYDRPFTMTSKDFCAAIGIAPSGTVKRIQGSPTELVELYRGVTNYDDRTA